MREIKTINCNISLPSDVIDDLINDYNKSNSDMISSGLDEISFDNYISYIINEYLVSITEPYEYID